MRWHTPPPEALRWRELDGELVVRNALTGHTHLLSPLAGEVLRLLHETNETMTTEEIFLRLGGSAEEGQGAAEALAEALDRLAHMGLVQPAG